MKKINIICGMLAVAAVLSGCNSPANESNGDEDKAVQTAAKYNVMVYGLSDSAESGTAAIEYVFADKNTYEDVLVPEVMTVEIDGQQFTGTFKNTQYLGLQFYPTYYYVDSDRNEFSVDPDGMVTGYLDRNRIDRNWNSSDDAEFVSQEECVRAAKDLLSALVDISLYEIEIEAYDEFKEYLIYFTKYIDGIKTADKVRFRVSYSGYICGYSSILLGKIPSDAKNNFDMEKAQAAVFSRLDEIYADKKAHYDRVEYEPYITLTILKDGSIALAYDVDVSFYIDYDDGGYLKTSDVIWLIVTE